MSILGLNLLNQGSRAITGEGILGNVKDLNPFATSEKGSGMAQANTLEHAIDKLDKANDFEAIEIADKIRARIREGVTNKRTFFNIIESNLGYPLNSIEGSRKDPYIRQMMDEEIKEGQIEILEAERRSVSGPIMAGVGSSRNTTLGPVQKVIAYGILGGLIFWGLQSGRK